MKIARKGIGDTVLFSREPLAVFSDLMVHVPPGMRPRDGNSRRHLYFIIIIFAEVGFLKPPRARSAVRHR